MSSDERIFMNNEGLAIEGVDFSSAPRRYYDSKGNPLSLDTYDYLEHENEGPRTDLFLDKDKQTILKIYTPLHSFEHAGEFGELPHVTYPVFDAIKTLHNPHLVDVYERYYTHTADLSNQENLPIEAYTKAYVPYQKPKVLKNNKDYLLDNIADFESLFDLLAQKGILAKFSHDGIWAFGQSVSEQAISSITATPSGLMLTNPDFLQMAKDYDKGVIRAQNKKELSILLRELMIIENQKSLFKMHGFEPNIAICELFDGLENEQNIALELNRRLVTSRRPIDYVKHHIR